MAYYNYKRVIKAIPRDWAEAYEKQWLEECGHEFEGTCDYDGDLWCMAADYIEHLHSTSANVRALSAKLSSVGFTNPITRNVGYALRCAIDGIKPEFDVNGFLVDPTEKCCPECDP